MSRFTKQQLFSLRNDIPIRSLMQQVLALSLRQLDGVLRFQCPRCARFHTAIHPKVNLARCFDCRENFNTIELVMAVRRISFPEATAFLQKHLEKTGGAHRPTRQIQPNAEFIPGAGKEQTASPTNPGEPSHIPHREGRDIPQGLIHIRETLKRI